MDIKTEDINVVEMLDRRGEGILKANMSDGESIVVSLKGLFGEAFVVTDRRVYVLKYGFMAGRTFGGQCTAYGFNQITGIEIRKTLLTGVVEVLTAADKNTKGKTFWGTGGAQGTSAIQADNMITFQIASQGRAFQKGVAIACDTIQTAQSAGASPVAGQQSVASEIEKLASLRDKGILTEEEFQAKKRQLLGL